MFKVGSLVQHTFVVRTLARQEDNISHGQAKANEREVTWNVSVVVVQVETRVTQGRSVSRVAGRQAGRLWVSCR